MSRTTIDTRSRARFREAARSIVSRDRASKKLGIRQDTIGEIERALVRAFAFGCELGDAPCADPRPDHLGIEWEEVPPRGRGVLAGMTYRLSGREVTNPVGLRRSPRDQQIPWVEEYEDGRGNDYSVANGSVGPLLSAGLLAPADVDGELLVLTAKGRATCEAYWRRRWDRDPSLPKESVRA